MAFVPRTQFAYPSRAPNWFIGHMSKGMRMMTEQLSAMDVIVEARDARLPLTGINYEFEKMINKGWSNRSKLGGLTERIVVYTKRDLAEERYEAPLQRAFKELAGHHVVFSDSKNDGDPRAVQRQLVDIANHHQLPKLNVLVAGMPNVGKSTLLNGLRRVGMHRGKAAITGSDPGVTRKLAGTVKIHENPHVYVYDTPGIMVPFLGHDERGLEMGLKLALTSGIKPDLVETETILDYLLYRLNLRGSDFPQYQSQLPLGSNYPSTNSIDTLLTDLGKRVGALRKGGIVDMDASAQFLMRAMRNGKFGRWTLDEFGSVGDSVDDRVHNTLKSHLIAQRDSIDNDARRSKSSILKQARKQAKLDAKRRREARRVHK